MTTLSVGAGLLVTGGIFFGTANKSASDARTATTWEVLQKETSAGRSYQTLGGVLTGVGAAAVAGGIVMLIVSGVTGAAPANLSVALAPGGGVAVVSGAFP